MRKVKLGEILKVTRGQALPSNFYNESGSLIRLTLGNFKYPENGFKYNTSKKDLYYTVKVDKKFILKKDDLITPLTEQVKGLLGNTAYIPKSNTFIQSGDIGLIHPNKNYVLREYCYYLLSSEIIKKQLSASAQQTKIRHTSPTIIESCVAWIPGLDDQRHIVDIKGDSILWN